MSDTTLEAPRPRPVRPQPAAETKAPSGEMPIPVDGAVSEDDPRRAGFVRQPFGSVRSRLHAEVRPGYHRHWFNDTPGRIVDAKKAGYTHVFEKGTTKPMKTVVGSAKTGGGLDAYLMEIPKEWFEEDFARKQANVDEIDEAIRGDKIARKPDDKRYTPQGAIKIEEG